MSWDYIIIGAGSAGCALAHELAIGRPDSTVLVLEAGGKGSSPFIRLQAGVFHAIARHDWGYHSQPDPSRNGMTERWIRGRVLGGTSSINSALLVRGAAHDFDRWAEQSSSPQWSARQVLALFRELESSDQAGPLRGHSGPLHVRTVKRAHALTEAFTRATYAAGYPFNPDYNGETQEGVAYAQLNQHRGLRCSAADAFLRPLLGKSQIELLLNAWVEKIEFGNGRAEAVSFIHRGHRRREAARRIVLCAGSINSPKLLMLSGIGDAEELRRHRIDSVLNLPGVGNNLKEHPLVLLKYRSRIPTYNLTGGLRQKLSFASQFLTTLEGPIVNIFESVAFLRSSPSEPYPDTQLHFVPMAWSFTAAGKITLAACPSITVFVNKSHPVSRGRIRLVSSDPKAPPFIECRLFEEEADLDTLVRGAMTVRRILQEEPIASLLEEELEPGPQVASVAAMKDYIRQHGLIANHSVGTCAMGTGADAVVGPDLRVRGMENLWVADASIMPDHISGNTNATCMMIGKKLGKQLTAG